MSAQAPPLHKSNFQRLAFVMELQAGMKTQYLNWRGAVEQMPDIAPTWIPISYYEPGGWVERMRFLPGSVRGPWRSYLQVGRGLGKAKFDAVLFNTYNPAVVHQKSLSEQRCFLMFDVTPKQYDEMAVLYERKSDSPNSALARLKHRQVCRAFQKAEGLFAWSNWAAKSAVEDYGADPKRVSILPPGVDPHHWKPGVKPGDGIVRILFTGGHFHRKGGDLLLDWAKRTTRKGWELHLITLEPLQHLPANVVVHNHLSNNTPEFIELAQKCDLFVLPTRADCFSIASLEAMSVGMPVVTCDVGGIADIVEEGETGFLLSGNDEAALQDRIERLLEDKALRERMGKRGREVVLQKFDVSVLVRQGIERMTP